MHYQRLTKGGSLAQPISTASDEQRFWSKVARTPAADRCWRWLAGIHPVTGYGNVWWEGRTQLAHRVAFELATGEPIAYGWTIDHLCRNRACVNPTHLQQVTQKVNNARGTSPSANNARKLICKWGHEFTPENTYIRPDRGTRSCKECARAASRLAKSGQ